MQTPGSYSGFASDEASKPLNEVDFDFLDYLVKMSVEALVPSAKRMFALAMRRSQPTEPRREARAPHPGVSPPFVCRLGLDQVDLATMSLALKKLLFDEYDGFADKRYKKLTNDAPFAVDDRGPSDQDAKGDFYLWFCAIYVHVDGNNTFKLTLTGGVPLSAAVEKLVAKKAGSATQGAYASSISINLTTDDGTFLRDLASAIEAIVAPGNKYDVAAYKYVCPRTAQSLRRLAELMDDNAAGLRASGAPMKGSGTSGSLF